MRSISPRVVSRSASDPSRSASAASLGDAILDSLNGSRALLEISLERRERRRPIFRIRRLLVGLSAETGAFAPQLPLALLELRLRSAQ